MADKSIDQLNEAEKIYATDLFVLQQSGSAKKLTGQVLLNWLTAAADGHGGIQSIAKLSTSVLADTYRITLADTTTFDFVVNNGRGITGISKTSTSGLVDTYTISYNDGTTGKFTVTNGEKGDKGDNAYIWIKYASQKPTESSHSMGDIPDDWIGIYSGNASTAPTDWQKYKWFKHKGEKGDTGSPATLVTKSVTYQVSDSGTIIPSGSWVSSVPVVPQGKYLWTKTELQFNTGDPIVSYSVARMGMDGSGTVSTVSGVSPDETGNVPLTSADVGALAVSGGNMAGEINMNGQPISGLNAPTEDTQAANKGYVDTAVRNAAPKNLLDNSDFRNPVNQRGKTTDNATDWADAIDRWIFGNVTYKLTTNGITLTPYGSGKEHLLAQYLEKQDFLIGKKITFAVGLSNGNVCIATGTVPQKSDWAHIAQAELNGVNLEVVWSGGTNYLMPRILVSQETTVAWAALYEGEYTAETLPEYQPKGYMVEALNCGGVSMANSVVMEYSLGTSFTDEQSADIRSGNFEKVHVGGYWTINGRKYWAAHADYRLHCGDTELTTHHMLVIPEKSLLNMNWNGTNDTTGGYASSKVKTEGMAQALEIVKGDFGADHILNHRIILTNAVSNGASSGWAWYDSQIDLMNEHMVYGSHAWGGGSQNGYDTGADKSQLALFQARPDLITNRETWWLRDVYSASHPCIVEDKGTGSAWGASESIGVRPAFLIY